MQQWHPAPRAMIDDELMRRWTRDNPAPDLVVHMVLVSRILSGNPWGRAKLAAWSGLSKHRASSAIRAAQQWVDEWQSGTFLPVGDQQRGQQSPANPDSCDDESGNNQAEDGQKSGKNQHHGRGITDTKQNNTKQNNNYDDDNDDDEETKPVGNEKVRQLWADLNARRAIDKGGKARTLKLTPQIARALREALTYSQPVDVLRAYEWFLTAADARWWQDNGCDLITFCRQKHIGEFINKAQEWTPEIEAKQQAEAANVIPF